VYGYQDKLYSLRFESRLKSNQVFDNLRARGREWRESRIPDELKKIGVKGLDVRLNDDEFMMQWTGNVSPVYSPALKGVIEDTRAGSDVKARFGIMPVRAGAAVYLIWLPLETALHPHSIFRWVLLVVMGLLLLYTVGRGRGRTEVFKKHLLRVMDEALKTAPIENRAFMRPVPTNGP
jgi:hypothetical protein